MSNKSPKYPIEPTDHDDPAPASATRRDEPPPYGAPAFRHRHEVREGAERSDVAYLRSHPEFSRRPHRRGAGRRVW
jgi:hypothetical protein